MNIHLQICICGIFSFLLSILITTIRMILKAEEHYGPLENFDIWMAARLWAEYWDDEF